VRHVLIRGLPGLTPSGQGRRAGLKLGHVLGGELVEVGHDTGVERRLPLLWGHPVKILGSQHGMTRDVLRHQSSHRSVDQRPGYRRKGEQACAYEKGEELDLKADRILEIVEPPDG
jgi:hypothetical protein